MEDTKRIAVVAIELPWRNIECIGVARSFEEANEKALTHAKYFFDVTAGGKRPEFFPLEDFGSTTIESKDGDGYEFLYLDAPFDGCYVMVEDRQTGDIDYKGPYHDHAEANAKVFRKGSKLAFRMVAGTFDMGFYPVEGRRKTYTYIPVYGG